MRLVCFANNWTGWQVLEYLRGQPDQIVALVIHPPPKRKFGDEILATIDLPANRIFDGSRLRDPDVIDAIGKLEPDLGVSLLFGYILRKPLLDLFPAGVINLHPGYLPFNRGPYPVNGGASIVNNTSFNITRGFEADGSIPSMREIIDLGDLGASLTVNTTGQSGHPYNKHYDDMIELWANVEYHPMLWDRAQVEAAAAQHLTLTTP